MPFDFDPNAPEKKPQTQPEWATYTPWPFGKRGKKFKTHTKLHHATSAVDTQMGNGVALYHFENGEWVEVLHVERDWNNKGAFVLNRQPMTIKNDDECDRCKRRMCDNHGYWEPRFTWKREKGRIANPPQLVKMCGECQRRK